MAAKGDCRAISVNLKDWQPMDLAIQAVEGRWRVVVPTSHPMLFFKLRKPLNP